ncbi:MAG: DUF2934 domain-containing protein [Solirubrobacterales bacterium]|nr:DUF2934 domain-containing protein [Solirubrobacterales bacterium]
MPAKSTKSTGPAKPSRPAARKRTAAPRRGTRSGAGQRRPEHSQIAERAYFIHLEEGHSDELANWLRAERELMVA